MSDKIVSTEAITTPPKEEVVEPVAFKVGDRRDDVVDWTQYPERPYEEAKADD